MGGDAGGIGWIVVGLVHGLDHVEAHDGAAAVTARVAALRDRLHAAPAGASGVLLDGAWLWTEDPDAALAAALAGAATPAAIGLGRGALSLVGGAPQGRAARAAWRAALAVRHREIAVASSDAPALTLPRGVGSFQAPEALGGPAAALVLIRDYRA